MTANNQDFDIYNDDDWEIIFTVVDNAGAAINLSGCTEITWWLYDGRRNIKLTKLKTTGGIDFVTSGTDGKIRVNGTAADFDLGLAGVMEGDFFHGAQGVDATGAPFTFVAGSRVLLKVRAAGD